MNLRQREHLNPALGRGTGPDARFHAGSHADSLFTRRRITDDAAADRLAGVELVQNGAALGVERAEAAREIRREDQAPGRRLHYPDHGSRAS